MLFARLARPILRRLPPPPRPPPRRLSSEVQLILNADETAAAISSSAAAASAALATHGYYSTTDFLPRPSIAAMRNQSVLLRSLGRFEPSYSELIVDGVATRFDKEGVHACEPDGADYYDAPDLVTYMSVLLRTLPAALNGEAPTARMELSNESFNAKLAVTEGGGARYPLHVDNPQGLAAGDTRKLTCILYLNPDWAEGDGGELRILTNREEDGPLEAADLSPEGGRLLMFWSDEVPHEVLPTAGAADGGEAKDRYALTVWMPTGRPGAIHDGASRFSGLADAAFRPRRQVK